MSLVIFTTRELISSSKLIRRLNFQRTYAEMSTKSISGTLTMTSIRLRFVLERTVTQLLTTVTSTQSKLSPKCLLTTWRKRSWYSECMVSQMSSQNPRNQTLKSLLKSLFSQWTNPRPSSEINQPMPVLTNHAAMSQFKKTLKHSHQANLNR